MCVHAIFHHCNSWNLQIRVVELILLICIIVLTIFFSTTITHYIRGVSFKGGRLFVSTISVLGNGDTPCGGKMHFCVQPALEKLFK